MRALWAANVLPLKRSLTRGGEEGEAKEYTCGKNEVSSRQIEWNVAGGLLTGWWLSVLRVAVVVDLIFYDRQDRDGP